ncbi:hypothetical protein SAMN06265360_121102 [Haloechinothrix alba]|uniref:Integrase core domain-containing protein n=1 Tax=Haloechinothrix alba TaxID=664784 RepID=A0A238ZIZ8_9PSEU|nr:hypothetical protein [Haloechinothrix alba]SNR83109.1 hypothetical protein SAMN06265360_121102 [Haloechinothrix alba]
MHTEVLDRKTWMTGIGLAKAIVEYLEIFYDRRRRHSALGMLTPTAHEHHPTVQPVARDPTTRHNKTQATSPPHAVHNTAPPSLRHACSRRPTGRRRRPIHRQSDHRHQMVQQVTCENPPVARSS